VDPRDGVCAVYGAFHVELPPQAAWSVLADYDHIPEFVHSMQSSVAERDSAGRLHVVQTARGGLFVFHKNVHVVLEIEEEPDRRIGFRDTLGKDFEHYVGEWRLDPDSTGTRVSYALDAAPRSALSRSLCRRVLKNSAEDLLVQVRNEILRRKSEGTHLENP
jgi:carbon monoxide dehydrogenase subunit G